MIEIWHKAVKIYYSITFSAILNLTMLQKHINAPAKRLFDNIYAV